jgi:hypothetical protein
VLDRIDQIVPPGATINVADNMWNFATPTLTAAYRRQRNSLPAGTGHLCAAQPGRRHIYMMLAEQTRLAPGSVQACHEAVNDGEGRVYQGG